MKTFKDKNPLGRKLTLTTIERFIQQQYKTLELLDAARKVSLSKTKTSISISSFITLRLGDTFRVVIYHNQRHLVQAFNMLSEHKFFLPHQSHSKRTLIVENSISSYTSLKPQRPLTSDVEGE